MSKIKSLKRRLKVIDIGVGKPCHKCEVPTVIRKSVKLNSYYTQWEFCKSCNAVYFEEKYRRVVGEGTPEPVNVYNTYNISLF